MKHIKLLPVIAAASTLLAVGCTDDIAEANFKPSAPEELVDSIATELGSYKCPTYADDYTSIAGWEYRSQWNLANVHDPTVMKAADGYYYMYQTDASYGNAHSGNGHYHARRSKNLVDWQYMGAAANEKAFAWVKDSLNSMRARMGLDPIYSPSLGYWAPCVRKVNDNLYRMYYSIVVDNYIKTGAANTTANFDGSWTERAFIGVMECSDPALNQWEDKGYVICSVSDKGLDYNRASATGYADAYFKFNAIDPTFVITPEGEHWLIYGSWHSGFAAVQLNPETGKTLNPLSEPWADDISSYGEQIFTRVSSGSWKRWQGAEAPEIVYRDGYYYLFCAYDGLDVPYNTRVLRSQKITGPYVTADGTSAIGCSNSPTVVTHPYKFGTDHGWVGISHCAVFDDGDGNYYYVSQQRFPVNYGGNSASNAIMLGGIRSIQWLSSGWPVVMPERYGKVPQATISKSELVGTWEVIDLSYKASVQKTSTKLILKSNGTYTTDGNETGSWTFKDNTLSLGSGTEYAVQREVDWEASPRKVTLVFSGMKQSNLKTTFWGKQTSKATK